MLSLLIPFLILDNSIAIRYMKTLTPAEQWPRLCFAESYQFVVLSSVSWRRYLPVSFSQEGCLMTLEDTD